MAVAKRFPKSTIPSIVVNRPTNHTTLLNQPIEAAVLMSAAVEYSLPNMGKFSAKPSSPRTQYHITYHAFYPGYVAGPTAAQYAASTRSKAGQHSFHDGDNASEGRLMFMKGRPGGVVCVPTGNHNASVLLQIPLSLDPLQCRE